MKLLRLFVLTVLILAAALPTLAQEASSQAAESASQVYFPTTLLLLMGIGAVLVVGAVVIMRERGDHEVD
jgi:cytochrome c biogenesis factor